MPHHIIAVMARDQLHLIDRKLVSWSLEQESSTEEWNRLAQAITQKIAEDPSKPDLNLIFSGGDGDMGLNGRPIILNSQTLQKIRSRLEVFKKAGIRFRNIVLNPCCSASFIPEFQDILADDGVLFCQLLSSTDTISLLLNLASDNGGNLFSACMEAFSKKRRESNDVARSMGHTEFPPFISAAVYLQSNQTLYHLETENVRAALEAHNDLVGARFHEPDTVDELYNLKAYLKGKGVKTVDRHFTFSSMALALRFLRSNPRLVIEPLQLMEPTPPERQSADLERILSIDHTIFPNERQFTEVDLRGYWGEGYSYIVRVPDHPDEICGYIFGKLHPAGGTIFIGDLGVHPAYQGLGIGRALLEKVIEQAEKAQLAMRLQVRPDNHAARNLYASLGFEETRTSDRWIYMQRDAIQPIVTAAIEPRLFQYKKGLSATFLLTVISGLVAGAGLIALACLLLPPVGLIAMSAVLAYAFSATGGAAGLGLIGFFGYHAVKECSGLPRQNSSPG